MWQYRMLLSSLDRCYVKVCSHGLIGLCTADCFPQTTVLTTCSIELRLWLVETLRWCLLPNFIDGSKLQLYSVLWHCWLDKGNDIQPTEILGHLSPKVLDSNRFTAIIQVNLF